MEIAAHVVANERAALLRGEHEVDEDFGEGLGHAGYTPSGLGRSWPGVTWASARLAALRWATAQADE